MQLLLLQLLFFTLHTHIISLLFSPQQMLISGPLLQVFFPQNNICQVYATGGREGVQVWSDAGQLLLHIQSQRPDLHVKKVTRSYILSDKVIVSRDSYFSESFIIKSVPYALVLRTLICVMSCFEKNNLKLLLSSMKTIQKAFWYNWFKRACRFQCSG